MIRIRYRKRKNGTLESVRTFKSEHTGAEYKVYIDPATCVFRIYNVNSRRNVKVGKDTVNNLEVVYRYVRRALKSLGVKLKHEVRNV